MNTDSLFAYFGKERGSLSREIFKEPCASLYKEYKRFPRISLPEPSTLDNAYSSLLRMRASSAVSGGAPLAIEQISTLLYWSVGERGKSRENTQNTRRMYPSGGAKYPLEIYPIIMRASGISAGAYHYNVRHRALERLVFVNSEGLWNALCTEILDEHSRKCAVVLLFSFVKGRSVEKYGELAHKLALLEAGHVSQNVYLAATAIQIDVCAQGVVSSSSVQKELHLDGVNESIFYAVSAGAHV